MSPNDFYAGAIAAFVVILFTKFLAHRERRPDRRIWSVGHVICVLVALIGLLISLAVLGNSSFRDLEDRSSSIRDLEGNARWVTFVLVAIAAMILALDVAWPQKRREKTIESRRSLSRRRGSISREKQETWQERWGAPSWWRPWWWWIGVGATPVFILVWWLLPPLLYRHLGANPDARVKAITDTRTALLAGLLGLGALLTFWLNSREHRLTEQGQITDRYSKAIEQLGKTQDEQIGAIYALERIMVESARDQNAIVEVLTAFIRKHAPCNGTVPAGLGPEPSKGTGNRPLAQDTGLPKRPPTQIQAALAVLGRRPDRADLEADCLRLSDTDLEGSRLRGANLQCVRLRRTRLAHAHLERSNLEGAQMPGAFLGHAYLEGAQLNYANLVGASLVGTNLKDTSLVGAHLAGTSGDPTLTEEQKGQVHCLPDRKTCPGDFRPPDDHLCARFDL